MFPFFYGEKMRTKELIIKFNRLITTKQNIYYNKKDLEGIKNGTRNN